MHCQSEYMKDKLYFRKEAICRFHTIVFIFFPLCITVYCWDLSNPCNMIYTIHSWYVAFDLHDLHPINAGLYNHIHQEWLFLPACIAYTQPSLIFMQAFQPILDSSRALSSGSLPQMSFYSLIIIMACYLPKSEH